MVCVSGGAVGCAAADGCRSARGAVVVERRWLAVVLVAVLVVVVSCSGGGGVLGGGPDAPGGSGDAGGFGDVGGSGGVEGGDVFYVGAGRAVPPGGVFTDVSAGVYGSCGVRAGGVLECWGDGFGEAVPVGSFVGVGEPGHV